MTLLMSGFALDAASAVARAERRTIYEARRGAANPGPIIVAEGDSWFCYPRVTASAPIDMISALLTEFAILDVATPGDVARRIKDFMDQDVIANIRQENADILLLSAGGNDLLGDGRLHVLLRDGDRQPPQYFTPAYAEVFWGVVDDIEAVIRRATASLPGLKVITQGYDYAIPTPGGHWLGGPMEGLGIPRRNWRPIVDRMVDQFNVALDRLCNRLDAELTGGAGRIRHCSMRGAVLEAQWHDELHPTSQGFAATARRMRAKILEVHPLVV